jgi:hypothetical protein
MTQSSTQSVSHTPGPWLWSEDLGILDVKIGPQSDNERFAYARLFVPTWDGSRPDDVDRANARLISGAPDLLNRSKALLDALDYQPLRELALQCGIPLYECAAALLDVIASIEGRA